MSFSDAIGQIDQIVQWEQQLANPAALTQTNTSSGTATGDQAGSTSSTSATTSAGDLLGSGDSQLLAALSSAGVSGATSTNAAGATSATAASAGDPRITAMVQEANSLVGKPYVWGGGHNNFGPQAGYDCSGFVSAVLHAGGYLSSPADTTTLPSQAGIEQGPGQHVTIYDRDAPGQQGHVIIEINGQFYESGGEQGSWGGGGGVAKISTPSASYLSTFNQFLHPAGL